MVCVESIRSSIHAFSVATHAHGGGAVLHAYASLLADPFAITEGILDAVTRVSVPHSAGITSASLYSSFQSQSMNVQYVTYDLSLSQGSLQSIISL